MTRYVPTSSELNAETMSAALWALCLPPDLQGGNVTEAAFALRTMTNGSVWLEVDTTLFVIVHQEAVLDGIGPILQPYIDAGQLPADTNTNLEALILASRGSALVLYDAFPALFKTLSKTQAELQTLGLWPASPTGT